MILYRCRQGKTFSADTFCFQCSIKRVVIEKIGYIEIDSANKDLYYFKNLQLIRWRFRNFMIAMAILFHVDKRFFVYTLYSNYGELST